MQTGKVKKTPPSGTAHSTVVTDQPTRTQPHRS